MWNIVGNQTEIIINEISGRIKFTRSRRVIRGYAESRGVRLSDTLRILSVIRENRLFNGLHKCQINLT